MTTRIIKLTALLATTIGAAAQNKTNMKTDSVKTAMQSIEKGVAKGYKTIENGVVSGYTAIQDGVVEGFTHVSDAFIMKFFAHEGETLEQAKKRMKSEEARIRQENEDRIAASRKCGSESLERAKATGKKHQ